MDVIYDYYTDDAEASIVSAEYALDQFKDHLWETEGFEFHLDILEKVLNPMYQSWLEEHADEFANEEGVYFLDETTRKERAEFVRKMFTIDYDYYLEWKSKPFWNETPLHTVGLTAFINSLFLIS